MTEFLRKVAEDLHSKHPEDLKDISIILPSKRSGLFLNKYLSETIGKAFIAPKVITWNDFLEKNTGFTILDNLGLVFKLYESYKEVNKKAEEFEVFNRWSSTILGDFNEIDNYMLPAKEVYKNLKDIKEIDNWSFLTDDLSEMQMDFSNFWNILGTLYTHFDDNLTREQFGYPGKLKKLLLDHSKDLVKNQGFTYWIGFYAISPSEQKLIDLFLSEKKGYVYWDADSFYVHNKSNLAGTFFRKSIAQKRKGYNWIEENIREKKDITLHEVPGHVFQCTIANEIIKDLDPDETALILADEKLLIPTLENLDKDIEDFNVSMRIPLDKSPFLILVNVLIDLHENARKSKKVHSKYRFYHKDLCTVLGNVILEKKESELSVNKIIQNYGRSLFSLNDVDFILKKLGLSDLLPIFKPVEILPNDLLDRLKHLIEYLKDKVNENNWDTFHKEMLYRSNHFFERLLNYCDQYSFISTSNSLKKIINDLAKEEQLDFFGEPLKGLQILGMLESRALDFKTVVLLGCNEGILPNKNIKPSFLPYDLKNHLGLPTFKDHESIFAYYFYRLFHKSRTVHLVYNTKDSPLEAGEKSRFISQLQFEHSFERFPSKIKIKAYSGKIKANFLENITINKDDNILKKLKEEVFLKLSPSAFLSYLNCPLDFYYKYVLRLSEENELEEKIQANTLGDVVHRILENFFKPFQGKMVSENDLEKMIARLEPECEKVLIEKKLDRIMRTSFNKLAKNAIVKMLSDHLKSEQSFAGKNELKIESVEREDLKAKIEFEDYSIGITGIVDRIDKVNGEIRIVDYKTGKVVLEDLKCKEIDLKHFKTKNKAFQLLFYHYLYKKTGVKESAHPFVFSMLNTRAGAIPLELKGSILISDQDLLEFEHALKEICDEMLDQKIAFEHNKNNQYCTFCRVN